MKHRRQLAAALACTLALGLCGGHVLADGTPAPTEAVQPAELIAPAPETGSAADTPAEDAQSDPTAPEAPSAGDGQSADSSVSTVLPSLASHRDLLVEAGDQVSQDADPEDSAGTVSFENLERRLRENNLNILALDESLESIDAVDLDEMHSGLTMAIWMLQSQQSQLEELVDGTSAALDGLQTILEGQNLGLDVSVFKPALIAYPQATISSLEAQIATYQATIDQIKDGTIEAEYEAAESQLMNAQDQIVVGAETLYISLLGLEQTTQSLERSLAALDRTLAELKVRYDMGQISALTLAEAEAGRTTLVSSMTTLDMNLTGLRRQLEGMLGLEEISGTIQLAPLVAVSAEDIAAMDLDADLKRVKRYSYALESANKTWSDAEDDYQAKRRSATAADYEVDAARYTARAANLSKQATEQSLELSFASLFDQVKDQQQVVAAARTSLAVKQDSYAAAQLKYEQGAISYNELCDASDALEDARDTLETANIDLFTYYNNYRWAVDHGILN